MTKTKSTKRALLMSALALLMCVSMLIGSTYAWFTDSVTSGNNKIVSGNLDVVLEYKSNWDDAWTVVDENTKIFKEGALYEPGYTEVVFLRVSNAGSLALKYNLMVDIASEKSSVNVDGKEFNLSDYLQIGAYTQAEYASGANYADLLMPVMFGSREEALSNVALAKLATADSIVSSDTPVLVGEDTAQVTALVLTMPTTVGNEANYDANVAAAPEINLGVNLVATQLMQEKDSFNNQYDEDAKYPAVVTNAAELVDALAEGKNVVLADDVKMENEALAVTAGQNVIIDLGGNTLTTVNTEAKASAAINNKGTLTLKNGTVTYEGVGDPNFGYGTNTINNTGKLVIDGATIINTTASGSSVAIDCSAGAELIVNSGVIESVKNAIRLCPFANGAINCTINGGTITGARAIQIQLPSNKPAEAPEINLTVNGGTLSALDTVNEFAVYSYSAGQSFDNVNVTITGGTFNGYVAFGGGSAVDDEHVTITGGTFNNGVWRLDDGNWVEIPTP